jgi:hypothetical protein
MHFKIKFVVNTKFAFFIGRNFFKMDRTLIEGRCNLLMPTAKSGLVYVHGHFLMVIFAHNVVNPMMDLDKKKYQDLRLPQHEIV